MPRSAALKKKSSQGEFFKDIQLSLFEFLKRDPLAKFKGKNLEGPLKYLKPSPPPLPMPSPSSSHHVNEHGHILPTKRNPNSVGQDADTSSTAFQNQTEQAADAPLILGFTTIIERKPYLRYLRFCLKPNGVLHITAPKNRPLTMIEQEVSEYKDWVLKKHHEYEKIRQRAPALRWQTGQAFPYLGESYFLKLEPFTGHRPLIQFDLDQLHYFYPETWDTKPLQEKSMLLRQALLKFYKEKAVLEIHARTRKWSEAMNLFPKHLSFRNQKTRWGSCSSEGKISFNWRLIAYAPELMDYIIIHELAHLKHQDHSARFWSLVERFCPQYDLCRKSLRHQQYDADFLAAESELYLENPILVDSNAIRTLTLSPIKEDQL
ncbi:MAG: M48 family metallopeptidase [Bdellovibrionaceae bacterium]|nr:M48 family metallopeptidase [Pseudobdellovibrionaceae bacterium]